MEQITCFLVDGMIGMLEGLFWLLELSEVEQALPLNDSVIISLMKCHVCIKFDILIFQVVRRS